MRLSEAVIHEQGKSQNNPRCEKRENSTPNVGGRNRSRASSYPPYHRTLNQPDCGVTRGHAKGSPMQPYYKRQDEHSRADETPISEFGRSPLTGKEPTSRI